MSLAWPAVCPAVRATSDRVETAAPSDAAPAGMTVMEGGGGGWEEATAAAAANGGGDEDEDDDDDEPPGAGDPFGGGGELCCSLVTCPESVNHHDS